MAGRAWIALVAYVGLLATLATSLYEPFESGEDDSWAIFAMLIAVHVGIGVAIARWWVLALPVAAGIVGFFATGGESLSWIIPIYGVPIALVVTTLGWLAGRRLDRRAVPVAAVVFAAAAAPAAWAGVQTIERSSAPRVPASIQRQLPIDESLVGDCERDVEVDRRGRALLRELERNPDAIVTETRYLAEDPGTDERELTVRELAEEQLDQLRAVPECHPELRHQIERAVD